MSDETYVVDETAEAITKEWERENDDLLYAQAHAMPESLVDHADFCEFYERISN